MRAMGKPTGLRALCRELGYSRQSYYQAKAREQERELEESKNPWAVLLSKNGC